MKVNKKFSRVVKKIIDYKALILWCILFVTIIIFIVFLINTFSNNVDNKKIISTIDDKESMTIYVENSDSKKCNDCLEIKKYLDDKKINYFLYDVNKVSESNYNDLLKKLNIDKDVFNYPAVIYIKDGKMYANIININDTKIVEQFIKDYDLK